MIEVIGKPLRQWNVGRSLMVDVEGATHLLLANEGDSYALRQAIEDAGVKIPDHLLQTNKHLIAQAIKIVFDDDQVEKSIETLESVTLQIRKAPRPENYIYEDDRRNYLYQLVKDANDAISAAKNTTDALINAAADTKNAIENANKAAKDAEDAAKEAHDAADEMRNTAVLVTPQDLEEKEKEQARKNIGAVGNDVKGGALYNVALLRLGDAIGDIVEFRSEFTDPLTYDKRVIIGTLFGKLRLGGISPGVRNDEVVTVEQLRDHIGSVSAATALKVTIDGEQASHTSQQIYDHIQGGGSVYLAGLNGFTICNHSAPHIALFSHQDESPIRTYYEIVEDGSVSMSEVEYAQTFEVKELQTQIGDIDTALDSIIAIQNELRGTISFTINEEPYTAIFGMTWKQWCASEYNTIGAYLMENGFVLSDIGGVYTGYGSDETPQYGDTVIVDGCEYYGM